MKEKDLIHDYKVQKYIFYTEKEDGSYGSAEGGSYLMENLIDDFWYKKRHMERSLRTRLLEGQISPLYYLMVLEDISAMELAARAGIRLGKVKKHLTPQGFGKMSIADAQKYTAALSQPLANLFQIGLTADDQNLFYHFYKPEEGKEEKIILRQEKTSSPYVVITKAQENTHE